MANLPPLFDEVRNKLTFTTQHSLALMWCRHRASLRAAPVYHTGRLRLPVAAGAARIRRLAALQYYYYPGSVHYFSHCTGCIALYITGIW